MSLKIELDFGKVLKLGYGKLLNIMSRFNIGHLLLISLALHLFVMSFPQDGYIFDEAHYVPAALKTLQLQPANAEHTPLAKILVALSIGIFGDYWFAWRIPIVITTMASLYVFYILAKRFMSRKYALFATAFLSFDIIYFVHGSIFVLDMPAILFGLIGVERYFAKSYRWSALAFGVSFLMKELGLFFLGTVLIYHLFTNLRVKNLKSIVNWKKFFGFFVILLLAGGGGLWIYDAVYKPSTGMTVFQNVQKNIVVDQNQTPITTVTIITNVTVGNIITNPIEHMTFALQYFAGLAPAIVTPESDFRPPWSWVLPIGNVFNSPKYFTVVVTSGEISHLIVNWVSQITPTVEYMLIPIVALSMFNIVKKKDKNKFGVLAISWIMVSYLPWLLLGIFVQRMTFNYYFIYTIPILALGIPHIWNSVPISEQYRNIGILLHLFLTIIFFVCFYPVVLMR